MIIKEEERNKASGGGTVARVGRVTDVTMKLPDEMGRLTVELMWRRDPSDDRPGRMKLVYPSKDKCRAVYDQIVSMLQVSFLIKRENVKSVIEERMES